MAGRGKSGKVGNGTWPTIDSELGKQYRQLQIEHKREIRSMERRAELYRAQGYQAALSELMPQIVAQDDRIVDLADALLDLDVADLNDYKALLKTVLNERARMVDRLQGAPTQRIESKSAVTHISLRDYMAQREQPSGSPAIPLEDFMRATDNREISGSSGAGALR